MEKQKLNASKRKVLGKKVKKIRKEGFLPANIYGKKIKSEAVQVNLKDFQKVYQRVGETGIVNLTVDEEKESRPILIHNLQLHPVTDFPLHADFYQVSLKEKIKAMIPVVLIGEAKAVVNKEGLLLTILNEIEVESLPMDLPEKIEIDVAKLAKVDEEIKVLDLKVDLAKVAVLTDKNLVICKIGSLITEEQKKELAAEAATKAAADAEKAAAATTAGTAPAAGTAPTETAKPEVKKEAAAPADKK